MLLELNIVDRLDIAPYDGEIEESLAESKRDKWWAYGLNKATKGIHLAVWSPASLLSSFNPMPLTDLVNSVVLPLLQRARKELAEYKGEDAEHYLYCLDIRIESCRNYIEGGVPPLPKSPTLEEIDIHNRFRSLLELS